jgi:hypothetical protein
MNEIKQGYNLGKGEVDSSILSGSTTKHNQIIIFPRSGSRPRVVIAQNGSRNAHVESWRSRGLCSAPVPGPEPGFFRGLKFAIPLSLPFWALIAAAVWAMVIR